MIKKIDSWEIEGIMDCPILVLGELVRWEREVDPDDYKALKKDRKWYHIHHQGAGLGCRHPEIVGTILEVSQSTKKKFKKLHAKYYEGNLGFMGDPTLNELIEYRNDLQTILKVDCNIRYEKLMESFYPIDPKFANKLSVEKLPKNKLCVL